MHFLDPSTAPRSARPRPGGLAGIRRLVAPLAAVAALAASPRAARADEPATLPATPQPFAYGVIVGSNEGGAGQETLRFAEDDARRVAGVLKELGRYQSADLRVLVRPRAADVARQIDEVAAKLRAHRERGEQAILFFYYSGHARANALSLGAEELPVSALRERLLMMPSTLTVVVLDACQSGAFARTKGAEPAADFSFNSVAKLQQKGIAVIASSSAQELSQESDELKGSYFTHHWVTALRGAGDADGDGRVSLDEAYRYAYRRTLASTAKTSVGTQHVTFENDLAGRGDLALTYPADAKARLELPSALDGALLVLQRPSGSAVAEVQKAPGSAVRLALPAGSYEGILRRAGRASSCTFALADGQSTTFDAGACTPIKDAPSKKKGDDDETSERSRWGAELGTGANFYARGPYTDRLHEFGYQRKLGTIDPDLPLAIRLQLGVSRSFTKHLVGVVHVSTLTTDSFERNVGAARDSFSFSSYAGVASVRAQTDLAGKWFGLWGQAGGGVGLGRSQLVIVPDQGATRTTSETHWGWVLAASAGLKVDFPRYLGVYAGAGYELAPVISNLVGDTLNVGGFSGQMGVRLRFEE